VGTYYEILGVPRTASAAEVRQAYLNLARERHPDRFPDPAEREAAQEFFKELTAAFNTLSKDRERRDYDQSLDRPRFTAPEEIARDAYTRGLQHHEAKNYHEAVELFRLAVAHLPGEPRFHAALARTLVRNPHWVREGIQSMEKAVQLAPRVAAFHGELAEMLLAQGLKLRARKSAEAALSLDAAEARALRVLEATDAGEPPPPPSSGGGLRSLLRRKS
jgi:tetratricopeptide (TPR) repeat protein